MGMVIMVYIPEDFQVNDSSVVRSFIAEYPFAMLLSASGEDITHLPLIAHKDGSIEGHMARNNPHCAAIEREDAATAIFYGPHAYISPTWYEPGKDAVPTWNYAVVHVCGTLHPMESETGLQDHLHRLVEKFESGKTPRYRTSDVSEEYLTRLSGYIIGFSIEVVHVEAKFKLGQNRTKHDIQGFLSALRNSSRPSDREFAEFAERFYSKMHE
jgi:transcriptional regulator